MHFEQLRPSFFIEERHKATETVNLETRDTKTMLAAVLVSVKLNAGSTRINIDGT
jgi:hypothetical protein